MQTAPDPIRVIRLTAPESRVPQLLALLREMPDVAAQPADGSSAWDVLERMRSEGRGLTAEDVADWHRWREEQAEPGAEGAA